MKALSTQTLARSRLHAMDIAPVFVAAVFSAFVVVQVATFFAHAGEILRTGASLATELRCSVGMLTDDLTCQGSAYEPASPVVPSPGLG